MTRVLNVSKINTTFKGRAVFIGGCAGTHGCISHDPSLLLLQSVKGLELISLLDTNCCGWGGTLARNDEKKSVEMAFDLIHQIQSAGAGLIISNEPGCLMHLMMVMKKKGIHIETRYIAEFF
jgi:Fe-S oxidoreductase